MPKNWPSSVSCVPGVAGKRKQPKWPEVRRAGEKNAQMVKISQEGIGHKPAAYVITVSDFSHSLPLTVQCNSVQGGQLGWQGQQQ